MSPIRPDIPVAVIANFVEAHYDFLTRSPQTQAGLSPAMSEAYHADRTLMWIGDPKLVFVSYAIPHAEELCSQFGYDGTSYATPLSPSASLSLDILCKPPLLQRLLAYAGPDMTIQLVPYATTPEFAKLAVALHRDHGIRVLLPESPRADSLWLRDYVDTKSGFHHLAGKWLPNSPDLLPEAYCCAGLTHAAATAYWFSVQGRACIVKPDTGESGLGSVIIQPDDLRSEQEISRLLERQPYWGQDKLVVEEYITTTVPVSPSVEVFVPAHGEGEPTVTYVCEQLFRDFGQFSGVIVSREQRAQPWYQPCIDSALVIAHNLQVRGYAGHFDLDAVVDSEGRPRLLEVNARRTGGTHVHEFAHFVFGPNYLDHVALLSWESIASDGISCVDELRLALSDLLYPIDAKQRGVVISITSALSHHQFGVLIVGHNTEDALSLHDALISRVHG